MHFHGLTTRNQFLKLLFKKDEQKWIPLSYCYNFTTLMSKKFPISKENNTSVKLMLPTVPILYLEVNQGGLCSYAIATVFQKILGKN